MGALMHGLLSSQEAKNMEGGRMMPPDGSGHRGKERPGGESAQATPAWMDAPPAQPQVRTGVASKGDSGLHTLGFFGLIIVIVGAAGFAGIAFWGPEKPLKSQNRLATDPPAPMTMPSLPESSDAPSPVVAAAPVESAAASPAPPDPGKKKKSGRGKKPR